MIAKMKDAMNTHTYIHDHQQTKGLDLLGEGDDDSENEPSHQKAACALA